MASAKSLMAEENFLCSICLAVFTQPTTIPCGHNFCLKCITNYWDTQTLFKCPLCNQDFYTKPMLRVNVIVAEMAAKFKNSVKPNCLDTCAESGNGNVLCDLCAGDKLTAIKSCLVCFTSYCETHLEPHWRISALKKHKLIPAAKNLESRICKIHDEPLVLFCIVDQAFLCECCKESEHKTHKTVTLEEEAEMKKTQLALGKKDADQMIQARQQKIREIQNSLGVSRNNAEQALSCSQQVMAAMEDYIRKSLSELTEVIETKEKKSETEAKVIINELKGEITAITQKKTQLEAVSLSNDPFTFLENFLSFTINSPALKDWSDVAVNTDQYTIQQAMEKLQTTITREISMLCDPSFKEKQRHAVDVTLDVDTANLSLNISEDGKQVAHVNRKKSGPNKPERFDLVLNVLGKEGFSSGKFYYEVQVKDKTQWDLGVANQSINRKGDIRLSPKTGYWTIWLRKGSEFTANVGPAINLHVREIPQKVGVFVDYDGGQVSFYDVDARAIIFSFTGCNFTEKVFPFFSPCASDGGKNSAPLIITPVGHSN